MHLRVVFLVMSQQCMVLNHLKLNYYSFYINVPFLIIDFIITFILTPISRVLKNFKVFLTILL